MITNEVKLIKKPFIGKYSLGKHTINIKSYNNILNRWGMIVGKNVIISFPYSISFPSTKIASENLKNEFIELLDKFNIKYEEYTNTKESEDIHSFRIKFPLDSIELIENNLNESQNSSSPKAVFVTGPAGSGKSTISKELLPSDWEIINVDIEYEKLLQKANIGTDIKDFDQKELSKAGELMSQARKSTDNIFNQLSKDGKNIIIDGTGASSKTLLKKKEQLESAGYNTFMIMVWSTPYTSLERNQNRERSLKPFIILKTWKSVIENIGIYKNEFKNNFVLINNDPDGKLEFDYDYIKQSFPSKSSGKTYTPEESAKLNKDKEELHSDITKLLSSIPEFDSMDEAKSKINQFISSNLNEIKIINQKQLEKEGYIYYEHINDWILWDEYSFNVKSMNDDGVGGKLYGKNYKGEEYKTWIDMDFYDEENWDVYDGIENMDVNDIQKLDNLNEVKLIKTNSKNNEVISLVNQIGLLINDQINKMINPDTNIIIYKYRNIINKFLNIFKIYDGPIHDRFRGELKYLNILNKDVESPQIIEFLNNIENKYIIDEIIVELKSILKIFNEYIEDDSDSLDESLFTKEFWKENLFEVKLVSQSKIDKIMSLYNKIQSYYAYYDSSSFNIPSKVSDIWDKYPEQWYEFSNEDFTNCYNDFKRLLDDIQQRDLDDYQADGKYDLHESKLDKKQYNKQFINLLKELSKYCCNKLNIPIPKIKIINNKKYTENNKSYGGYIPNNDQIFLVIYNRTLADSMRSLSHEIYHSYQNYNNLLTSEAGKDGDKFENQANAFSGKIMREFGRKYPEIFFMRYIS